MAPRLRGEWAFLSRALRVWLGGCGTQSRHEEPLVFLLAWRGHSLKVGKMGEGIQGKKQPSVVIQCTNSAVGSVA